MQCMMSILGTIFKYCSVARFGELYLKISDNRTYRKILRSRIIHCAINPRLDIWPIEEHLVAQRCEMQMFPGKHTQGIIQHGSKRGPQTWYSTYPGRPPHLVQYLSSPHLVQHLSRRIWDCVTGAQTPRFTQLSVEYLGVHRSPGYTSFHAVCILFNIGGSWYMHLQIILRHYYLHKITPKPLQKSHYKNAIFHPASHAMPKCISNRTDMVSLWKP